MEIYRYASGLKRALTYIIDMTIIAITASAISSLIYASIGYTDSLALRLEEMMGYYTAALSGNVATEEFITSFNNVLYCMGIEYLVTIPLYVVFSFIYLVLIPYKFGNTLGRTLTKVKVYSMDGSNPTFKQLMKREILGSCLFYLICGTPLIVVSSIIASLTLRSLVDRISNTKLMAIEKIININTSYDKRFEYDDYKDQKNDFKENKEDNIVEDDSEDEYMVV